MKKLLIFTVIGILMVAGSALAASINVRPVAGLSSLGDLQSFFNGTLTPLQNTNLGINAYTDQNSHALFIPSPQPLSDIVALMFYEGASSANSNVFGIYSASDPTKKLTIFPGPVSPPQNQIVSWVGNDVWLGTISGPATIVGFGRTFGYFLTSPDGTFYSEDDKNPGGLAQILIYQDKSFANEWYLGMEDLTRNIRDHSDSDFNDMIVKTSEVQVPEPMSLILLGLGLVGAGLYRRLR